MRGLPLSAALVECPKCRRRQSVTSGERESIDACLAERRLRLQRIARANRNKTSRDNPVDVSESPPPDPAEAPSSAAGLPSAIRNGVESGGGESDDDAASADSSTTENPRNLASGIDAFADFNQAASPPTTTTPTNQGAALSLCQAHPPSSHRLQA